MPERELTSGEINFQAEGRLLQELGERLVASPEVALVELVKNAYDADASVCEVRFTDSGKQLTVRDDGLGMTFDAFANRWMRIATSSKQDHPASRLYRRRVTGQKGIGRFAVRFLGGMLDLETVAFDEGRKQKTRLVAQFKWQEIDQQTDLGSTAVPYTLYEAPADARTGTTLSIRRLRVDADFVKSREFRTDVLRIVSPISGLERGPFEEAAAGSKRDPGFQVSLPDDPDQSESGVSIAADVLTNAWAQLKIELSAKDLAFTVRFLNEEKSARLRVAFPSHISKGSFADIRFFPKRPGVFRGKGINGKAAWKWVRDNHGVAVVDHGFRVKPYGFPEDDWLRLDIDAAHNQRDWRSKIGRDRFGILPAVKANPATNPALNLPNSFQLVGAVFVESRPPSLSRDETDLTPSMDREGFLDNDAFKDLKEIIRAGIEFLANEDKKRLLKEKEAKAAEAARQMRADLRAAVKFIEGSPSLSRSDKARLVSEYAGIAKRLESVEEYSAEARMKFSLMSSIGIVAAFMTHEAQQIMEALRDAAETLRRLAKGDPKFRTASETIDKSFDAISGQIEYTRSFVDSIGSPNPVVFKVAPQIRRIVQRFGDFARERDIEVECEVDDDLETAPVPIAVYSGILLNLYTNALKAIIAMKRDSGAKRVTFRAWNDPQWHVVEVLDTGVGVPPELRSRIWDPLFTTTSRLESPLGTGMGLGLSLVKQLVTEVGGRIEVVDPPPDYRTCFKVQLPRGKKGRG